VLVTLCRSRARQKEEEKTRNQQLPTIGSHITSFKNAIATGC
jgi:hypothetical protein